MPEPAQHAENVAPLVLRCQASFRGQCLCLVDGYGYHCPDGECDMAEHPDGGGAGSQDPSDEAQQRPLRGSMPSPATEHTDGLEVGE